jgi:hypothetical protein
MPSEPKAEQILEAVRARVASIVAGATYWYTPGEVSRDWKDASEVNSFPFYGVIEGALERNEKTMTQIEERLNVIIVGWVSGTSDVSRRTLLNRCASDLIKAIYADHSWGGLALWSRVVSVETDEATIIAKPFGYFELTMETFWVGARTTV